MRRHLDWGMRHTVALMMRVFQDEGYSGKDVVVVVGPVLVRAECCSTVLKMCFDG